MINGMNIVKFLDAYLEINWGAVKADVFNFPVVHHELRSNGEPGREIDMVLF